MLLLIMMSSLAGHLLSITLTHVQFSNQLLSLIVKTAVSSNF